MNFQIVKKNMGTKARSGVLETGHGAIQTPFFMPVGTNATVKGISAEELSSMGAQAILSNAYHVFLRPGLELIKQFGGLHQFMGWDKPLLTDSGGYQIFSLAQFRKVRDEGVTFRSHIDGSKYFLKPEDVIDVQRTLGSDMIMPLDECVPYPSDHKHAQKALKRTTHWARRAREYFLKLPGHEKQILFGIIQGAVFQDLRRQSAAEILDVGFDAYAIGGVSVGEPVNLMFETVEAVAPLLPEDRPRYLMGIGLPDQIVRAVGLGIDMFDTCIPTRLGRHGSAFTREGKLIVLNAEYTKDMSPLDKTCSCWVCRKYSRSYIRYLLKAGEILGLRFISYHNLHFYIHLMQEIRQAIGKGQFEEFQKNFLARYRTSAENSVVNGENMAGGQKT